MMMARLRVASRRLLPCTRSNRVEDANWSHLFQNRIEFLVHSSSRSNDHGLDELLKSTHPITANKSIPSKAGTDEDSNDVFNMERMHVFLKLLGNPHTGRTYKTIHVGGTKGKGTQIGITFFLLGESRICGRHV